VLVLAIDTSSAAVSTDVVDVAGGVVSILARRQTINARGHGEFLAPMIKAGVDEAGGTPAALGAVVVGTGPGAYTGLRVGLVTAAVMAEALGVPAYGVCSLDGIAACEHGEGDLLVITDARRKEVYWARYDARGDRIDGPNVSRPRDVPLDGVSDLAGVGARLSFQDRSRPNFQDRSRPNFPDRSRPKLLDRDYVRPADLIGLALDRIRSGAASEPLTPLYLRRPDAVEPGVRKAVTPWP
jgi:tRNA threonylcarbamoyl adenosine modification protein YeaZ